VTAFATSSAILWYTSNRFSQQASDSVYAADGCYGQIGGCREVFRRNKGPHGEGAEVTPEERRRHRGRMRQGASRWLRPLRQVRSGHSEMARGDGPV